MLDITYQGHSVRRQKALKDWNNVLELYKSGVTAADIAKKYKKTRSWVYWVLKKFRNNEI